MKNFILDEYLGDLETVVNIESGSRIAGGTEQVADFFEKRYKELGLKVIRHESDNGLGPCMEIWNRPESGEADILFLGHMDTVFQAGVVAERPFSQDGKYAYGPGVMDMKAGLLSTYYLIKEILEQNLDISFCVALNSDEEISSLDSMEWIKELARKAKCAIIMEPGRKNGEYVCERKGLARYSMKVKGVAAHAGVAPQDGASAIHEMARMITHLISLNHYEVGTSVNVGAVSGGTTANVVCDYAECQIDTRFDCIKEHEKIEKEMRYLEEHPTDSRIQITIQREGFRPPMVKTEKTERLMQLMDEKGRIIGLEMKWVKTGGGSDGNFVAFEGCPVVDGAGPAGDGAHSNKETLQIATIEPRLCLLFDTVKELAARKRVGD